MTHTSHRSHTAQKPIHPQMAGIVVRVRAGFWGSTFLLHLFVGPHGYSAIEDTHIPEARVLENQRRLVSAQ